MTTLRLIFVCLGLLLLSACPKPDYGDQMLAYVHTYAYTDSKKIVDADLHVRWPKALSDGLNAISGDLNTQAETLNSLTQNAIKRPLAGNTETLLNSLFEANNDRSVAEKLKYQIMRIIKDVEWLDGLCDSKSVFEAMKLDELGRSSPFKSITPQDGQVAVVVSNNMWESIGNFFAQTLPDLLGLSDYEEQNDKLAQAMEEYDKSVIQGDELFEFSQGICKENKEKMSDNMKHVTDLGKQSLDGALAIEKQLREQEYYIEHQIYKIRLEDLLNSQIFKIFKKTYVEKYMAQALRNITAHQRQLELLDKELHKHQNCLDSLDAIEQAKDELKRTQEDIKALKERLGTSDKSGSLNKLLSNDLKAELEHLFFALDELTTQALKSEESVKQSEGQRCH